MVGSFDDGVNNALVTCTAAQVTYHGFLYIFWVGFGLRLSRAVAAINIPGVQ